MLGQNLTTLLRTRATQEKQLKELNIRMNEAFKTSDAMDTLLTEALVQLKTHMFVMENIDKCAADSPNMLPSPIEIDERINELDSIVRSEERREEKPLMSHLASRDNAIAPRATNAAADKC